MNDTGICEALDKEIEELKIRLYEIAEGKDLNSEEVIEISQKLDSLIIKYYNKIL